jgi:hypothetical protein
MHAVAELALIAVMLASLGAGVVSIVWLIIEGFHVSPLWGLANWFLYPFGTLAFALNHWPRARRPVLLNVMAWAGVLLAFALMFAVKGSGYLHRG